MKAEFKDICFLLLMWKDKTKTIILQETVYGSLGNQDHCHVHYLNIWTCWTSMHTKSIQLEVNQRSGRNSCCLGQPESRHTLVWRNKVDRPFIKSSKINRGEAPQHVLLQLQATGILQEENTHSGMRFNPTPNLFSKPRLNKTCQL